MGQYTRAACGDHQLAETVGPPVPPAVIGPAQQIAPAARDRRRYAWLYEDEDIWGTDGTDCVPPSACGVDWHAPRV